MHTCGWCTCGGQSTDVEVAFSLPAVWVPSLSGLAVGTDEPSYLLSFMYFFKSKLCVWRTLTKCGWFQRGKNTNGSSRRREPMTTVCVFKLLPVCDTVSIFPIASAVIGKQCWSGVLFALLQTCISWPLIGHWSGGLLLPTSWAVFVLISWLLSSDWKLLLSPPQWDLGSQCDEICGFPPVMGDGRLLLKGPLRTGLVSPGGLT